MRLKDWAGALLPSRGVEVANEALYQRFKSLASRSNLVKDKDSIYDNFKQTVVDEAFKIHQWDTRAKENLVRCLKTSRNVFWLLSLFFVWVLFSVSEQRY